MRILLDVGYLAYALPLIKAEQLSMFGPAGMSATGVGGPRRVTQVRAHTRITSHGATFVSPHQTHARAPTNAEKTAERARALAARTQVHYVGGGRGQEPPAREAKMRPKKIAVRVTTALTPGSVVHVRGEPHIVVTAGAITRRAPTRLEADEESRTVGDYQQVTVRPANHLEQVELMGKRVASLQADVDYHVRAVARFRALALVNPDQRAHFEKEIRMTEMYLRPKDEARLALAQAAKRALEALPAPAPKVDPSGTTSLARVDR